MTVCAQDLTWLLHPVKPTEFLGDYFEQRPLHVSERPPDYFSALFGVDDIERYLFCVRPQAEQLSVLRDGAKDAAMEQEIARNPDRAPRALMDGYTLVLNGAQRYWPPLRELVAELSEFLACPVIVNVYCSGPGSQGFDTHADVHDVFVAQIAGSKRWRLYNPLYVLPIDGLPGDLHSLGPPESGELDPSALRATLTGEQVLKAGDLLYIPRGVPHDAVAHDELSIHLTLGMHPPTWYQMLTAMTQLVAIYDPAWRASIPLDIRRNNGALPSASELGKMFAASLERTGQDWSTEDLLALFHRDLGMKAGPAGPGRYLRSILDIENLAVSSVVERRPGARLRFAIRDKRAHLTFSGGNMSGPRKIVPALEFISKQGCFVVGQLPGQLSDSERLVLARRLIREGLLQIAGNDSR